MWKSLEGLSTASKGQMLPTAPEAFIMTYTHACARMHTHTHTHTQTHTCMQCPSRPSTLHHRHTPETVRLTRRLTCTLVSIVTPTATFQCTWVKSNLCHLFLPQELIIIKVSADLYNIPSLINSLTVLYSKIAYKLKSCDKYAKNVIRMLLNVRYNW